MFWSQVNSLQMQQSPINKWYNATQNWRKNKSTTLFTDQIHTYDCTQYCIIECLKILIIYDDRPLKVWCEMKYPYTTKYNKININKVPKATHLTYTELFVCLPEQMLSAPEQFVSLPEQLVCATEQLQNYSGIVRVSSGAVNNCSGTVSKSSGAVSKCSGAVTKVFGSS